MSFHDSVKKSFLKKHQNKVILVHKLLNSRTKTTLKSSVVICKALGTSPASLTSVASVSLLASTASKAQFTQKLHDPDGLIITVSKKTITSLILCGMDHQNPIFH